MNIVDLTTDPTTTLADLAVLRGLIAMLEDRLERANAEITRLRKQQR